MTLTSIRCQHILCVLISLMLLSPLASIAQSSYDSMQPFGFATRTSRTDASDASHYDITGGGAYDYEGCMASSSKIVLTADDVTSNSVIENAVKNYSVIIFDGSKGDIVLPEMISFKGIHDKTLLGINNARLCTKFYVTSDIKNRLDAAHVSSLSSSGNGFSLPNGVLVNEQREAMTRKIVIESTGDLKENYRKAGVFEFVSTCYNIIIRNIRFVGPGPIDCGGSDLLSFYDKTHHMWVDHCDFTDGQDGNFDITKEADYVTVSWCTFSYTDRAYDHMNTNLVGSSEDSPNDRGKLNITWAFNNWGNRCNQRMPMARYGRIHMLNNYYTCKGASTTINPRIESEFLIEGNYFASEVTNVFSQTNANAYVWKSTNNVSSGKSDKGTVTVPYFYEVKSVGDIPTHVGTWSGATIYKFNPIITKQPENQVLSAGEQASPLTIAASASNGGSLSYQWYSSTAKSNTGGTPVGTGVTYTPSGTGNGIMYYYCVVTEGDASVTSNLVSVSRAMSTDITLGSQNITMDVDNTYDVSISSTRSGDYIIKSGDESIATAEIVDGVLRITSHNPGVTSITINQDATTEYYAGESFVLVEVNSIEVGGTDIYSFADNIGSTAVVAGNTTIGSSIVLNSGDLVELSPSSGNVFKNEDYMSLAGAVGDSSKPFGVKIYSDSSKSNLLQTISITGGECGASLVLDRDYDKLYIERAGGTKTTINTLVVTRVDPSAISYTVSASAGEGGSASMKNSDTSTSISNGASVASGTKVTYTASANSGYRFVNWTNTSDDSQVSVSADYVVSVHSNTSLKANFASVSACDITKAVVAGVQATISGTNISVTVPYGAPTSDIPVILTLSDGATASPSVMTLGETEGAKSTQDIVVTAEDGITTKTYRLTVTRGINATLLEVRGSSGSTFTGTDCTSSENFGSSEDYSTGNTSSLTADTSSKVYRSNTINSITLNLTSLSATQIVIGGKSSGSSARTLTSVSVNGQVLDAGSYSVEGSITKNDKLYRVTISGLNIDKGSAVTLNWSGNVAHYYFEVIQKSPGSDPQPATYTVSYNLNGHGSTIADATGVTALPSTLPTPTATGYTFGGWYMDSGLSTPATAGSAISANTTLYAKWTIVAYDVKFYDGDTQYGQTQSVNHGSTVAKPSDPTKSDYTFLGWSLTNGGTTAESFPYTITANKTFYAIWQQNQQGGGDDDPEYTTPVIEGYRNVVTYSWESPDGEVNEKGGTIAYVNGEGNRLNYENVVGGVTYHTVCLNGKYANLSDLTSSANAGHMEITMNEGLSQGDKIVITAYRNKNDNNKAASVYMKFENGTVFNQKETWVNICSDANNSDYDNDGNQANTNEWIVPAEEEGTKKIVLTRGNSNTNLFITKIEIIRSIPSIALDASKNYSSFTEGTCDITFKRTFTTGEWTTLVLPFDVTTAQLIEAFGVDANNSELANIVRMEDDKIYFRTTAHITANVPMLAKISNTRGVDEITFKGVTVKNPDGKMKATSSDGNVELVGTYSSIGFDDVPESAYFLYGGKFYDWSYLYEVSPFTAYILPKNNVSAKGISLWVNGLPTGVKYVNVDEEDNQDDATYNIAGQRVNASAKGLLIRNGKKIFVR